MNCVYYFCEVWGVIFFFLSFALVFIVVYIIVNTSPNHIKCYLEHLWGNKTELKHAGRVFALYICMLCTCRHDSFCMNIVKYHHRRKKQRLSKCLKTVSCAMHWQWDWRFMGPSTRQVGLWHFLGRAFLREGSEMFSLGFAHFRSGYLSTLGLGMTGGCTW